MNLLFLMDPIEGIEPSGDSTSALMEAAQAAGHRLWIAELRSVEADPRPSVRARAIGVNPWFSTGDVERLPIESMDAVFIRTDPPVDEVYTWAMHVLDLVDRKQTLLINDPAGIRSANEKLYALRFPDLIPPTLVSADLGRIAEFVEEHGTAVAKPIDGHAGRGVLRLEYGDPNLPSILELQTGRGARPVVVQAHVDAGGGNHRIFLVDGQPVAAVNRSQVEGDFRTGDVDGVLDLSPEEVRLCQSVGPALTLDGLRFVGLDVMAGRLIEVNVTSPGGIRQLERLSGRPHAPEILERLLAPTHRPQEALA